jgi:hypothetical protein
VAGILVLFVAILGKVIGADGFQAYPTVELGVEPSTVAVAAVVALSGLAPRTRKPSRRRNA